MYRVFITTAWIGSGEPFEHTLPNGETALVYQTLPQAYNAADADGDILQPAPPGTPGFCFYDANGEPLSTVTVNLGANFFIEKKVTIQGDWCRLRLDGGAAWGFKTNAVGALYSDVDFVRLHSGFVNSAGVYVPKKATFERCLFAGCSGTGYSTGIYLVGVDILFADCAFVAVQGASWAIGGSVTNAEARRCTGAIDNRVRNRVDCVDMQNMTQAELDATFVKPPDLSATWNSELWRNVNLGLLPTSPYATGATSVTSDQEVYDVAGNRRKPGGALGAYECLSDVDGYYVGLQRSYKYVATKSTDDAPNVTAAYVGASASSALFNHIAILFDGAAAVEYYVPIGSSQGWRAATLVDNCVNLPQLTTSVVDIRATSANGDTTVLRFYDDAAPSGARDCAPFFNRRLFTNITGAPLTQEVSPSSVCYVGSSANFASIGASVAKVYVGGWSRVDLGDATVGELVLGLNAEAKTTGKVTLKNKTATSAAIFSRLKPTAPAEVTFKECAISDSASE